jgi:hypothetical protein
MQVPPQKTPVSEQQMHDALAAVVGQPATVWGPATPSQINNVVNMLMAQSAYETGHWSSVYNYNVSGVMYFGYGNYFILASSADGLPHDWRSYLPSPGSGLPTGTDSTTSGLAAGVSDWVALIHDHYPQAWAAGMRGG